MLLIQNKNSSFYPQKNTEELLLQFYERGEEISLLDVGIWQVYRGVIQLSRIDSNGKEVVLGWAKTNSAFGNWFDIFPAYRAQALSDVYVKWYSPREIQRQPLIARQLLAQLSDRLIKAEQFLTIIAIKKVEERLWQTLLMLQSEIGQAVNDGIRLPVRFTHQNLADAIGSTRVTVTRLLGDFQNRDWIRLDAHRHIVIKQRMALS